eukprot:364259-Chlamydomonas_euryale.AAC.13
MIVTMIVTLDSILACVLMCSVLRAISTTVFFRQAPALVLPAKRCRGPPARITTAMGVAGANELNSNCASPASKSARQVHEDQSAVVRPVLGCCDHAGPVATCPGLSRPDWACHAMLWPSCSCSVGVALVMR